MEENHFFWRKKKNQ